MRKFPVLHESWTTSLLRRLPEEPMHVKIALVAILVDLVSIAVHLHVPVVAIAAVIAIAASFVACVASADRYADREKWLESEATRLKWIDRRQCLLTPVELFLHGFLPWQWPVVRRHRRMRAALLHPARTCPFYKRTMIRELEKGGLTPEEAALWVEQDLRELESWAVS
ncbi:hypothetical protein [Bradyrhizobium sp. CCGUVB14]|uniref:hypothetical protein n=1 Tax=Bradyrhizobium sp. CCGUVB14 TaxID=2949628 RepID=UPI0020B27E18|nr:hypothetical protein [Bradyrhizobium sp. CCGUVB14]MCP3439799.1 hypothetical protein [Bradyrhizobium sp. CCGUVB14]